MLQGKHIPDYVRYHPDTVIRVKYILGLDKELLEDMSEDEQDQLEDSLSDGGRPARRANARAGYLGDWEKIGWMAASMYRRVPGVEFM